MDFFRGEAYQAYFDYLDSKGGFYYERWGDAPVHSIAAALFLPKDRIHIFDEIGYEVGSPFTIGSKELRTDVVSSTIRIRIVRARSARGSAEDAHAIAGARSVRSSHAARYGQR
jgi:hypothetical protein